jgi:hypothetical protein
MFQAIYNHPWHNPGLFLLAGAAFVAALARRQAWLMGYFTVFAFEIVADAMTTGELSPLAGSRWLTPVAITFVILGDLRFFLLLERFAEAVPRKLGAGAWARVLGFSLLVPVASTVVRLAFGIQEGRVTFLIYEIMFLVLALVLRFAVLPRRADSPFRSWLLLLCTFECVQYGLWALADVIILSGIDAGFLLRLLPNTLYYALFLPFALWKAPREAFE